MSAHHHGSGHHAAPKPAAEPKAPEPEAAEPESTADVFRERAVQLAKDANSALNGVSDGLGLTPKVEKNPYAMVAAALGLGYVVGGGLFTPTTVRLVRLGLKLASVPLVKDRLMDAAEAAVDAVVAGSEKKSEP